MLIRFSYWVYLQEFVRDLEVYGCVWESMGDLEEPMVEYEYESVCESVYESSCMSMGVYGCLRDSTLTEINSHHNT